jgi:hypothetical protein
MEPVPDFAEAWFRDSPKRHFMIQLASIFNETICSFESLGVSVEMATGDSEGLARWQADSAGSHQIATSVNSQAFFDHFDTIIMSGSR